MKIFLRFFSLLWIFGTVSLNCLATECLEDERPRDHLCPLSVDLLTDPVVAADGFTYQREYIERWFRTCIDSGSQVTSPITREVLTNLELRDNRLARNLISDWRGEQNPERAQQETVLSLEDFLFARTSLTFMERSKGTCKTIFSWVPSFN